MNSILENGDFTLNNAWQGSVFLIPSLLEISKMYANSSTKTTSDGFVAVDGIITNCSTNSYNQEITDYTFMGFSALFLIVISFLIRRVSYKKLVCGGRPGALLPMGMLDSHDQIIQFTLAFLSVSEDIYTFIFGFKSDFGKQIPIVKFFIKIAVVIALSITSYLTFAGLHNRFLIGYLFAAIMSGCYSYGSIVGSITYSNCLTGSKVVTFIFTAVVYSSIDLSLLVIFFYRIIKHLGNYGCTMIQNKPMLAHDMHFCELYVKILLTEKETKIEEKDDKEEKLKTILEFCQCDNIKEKVTEKVYKKIPGFSIPPRLVIGISVGSFFAYRIFIDQIFSMTPTIWEFLTAINLRYITTYTNLSTSFKIITSNISTYAITDIQNAYMFMCLFYIHLFIACALVAIVIGFVNSIIQSFLILRNYRLHFHRVTQKGFSFMTSLKYDRQPYELVLGFLRFSGYQAAHILWGILVIFFALTVLLYFLIGLFLLPLFYVEGSWSRRFVINYGPVLIASLILNFIQTLIVKYIFVKEKGELMEIDNRRAFIIFCHCLFFLNAMMGLFTCVKKILVWIFSGIICFCRIDFSSLPDYLHGCDTGHMCYIGFLYTEQYHHNPILRCFVKILMESQKPLQSGSLHVSNIHLTNDIQCEKLPTTRNVYRNKWKVAYSLIRNKSLLTTRKNFLINDIM